MHPLIEKGYLYIAQPPLYKVKRGKNELYIKDDHGFEDFVISSAIEEAEVFPGGNGASKKAAKKKATSSGKPNVVLKGKKLYDLLLLLGKAETALSHYERRGIDTRIIRLLVDEPQIDVKKMISSNGIKNLERMIKRHFKEEFPSDGEPSATTREDEETGAVTAVIFQTKKSDRDLNTRIDAFLLESKEFKNLRSAFGEITKIGEPPFVIKSGSEELSVNRGEDLLSQFRALGQKGLSVQRYKGLGEMNPDQLWETTMDPNNRTIRKVDIENDVNADDVFSTLMGDAVDPRREYIEKHAPEVQNLDI
jgi:DNA gyrase subunit B